MENKFELTKEILVKMLNEKEMEFTYDEIEALMDSEVEKPEEEMDTELVAMCAEILAKKYCPEILEKKDEPMYCPWEHEGKAETPEQPKKKRIVRLKYVALVAAVLAVLVVVVALPAGAKLFDNQASDKIIEFYEDYFKINLSDKEATQVDSDWINELILENLHTRMLPQALLGEDYEKVPDVQKSDDVTTIYIQISNKISDVTGSILITEYDNSTIAKANSSLIVSDMYDCFKQLSVGEKEIIVFSKGEESCISYVDDNISYDIALTCDFDTMVSIAKTIKEKG